MLVAVAALVATYGLRARGLLVTQEPHRIVPDIIFESDVVHAVHSNSLCRSGELQPEDVALKTGSRNITSQVGNLWEGLFARWRNRKVLLAGDSLIDQFFQVSVCAAEIMGATVSLSNVLKVEWNGDSSVIVNTSTFAWGQVPIGKAFNENSQALLFRASVKGLPSRGGHTSFTLDYYRYYSFTERCRHCGEGCGACSYEMAFVSKIETLAWIAPGYDQVLINLGHDMVKPERQQLRRKAELMCEVASAMGFRPRMTLLEHPPTHFPTPTGDYNDSLNHTQCRCDAPDLAAQNAHVNGAVLGSVAAKSNISVAHLWKPFSRDGCTRHRPPDCTHYHISPSLWSRAVAEILRASPA